MHPDCDFSSVFNIHKKWAFHMKKVRIGLIGGGWRAEFYARVAGQLPERFEIRCVYTRDAGKAADFSSRFSVPATARWEDFLHADLDFAVLAVKRDAVPEFLEKLFQEKIPVLCETPPADTIEGLRRLWELKAKYDPEISVAEQYYLQPYHQSILAILDQGLLGEVSGVKISMMHGYHAANMIRRYLGINFENCSIRGKRSDVPAVRNCGRGGLVKSGETVQSRRDLLTLDFENGKTALYDFDGEQYFSYIRTRHLCVSGIRGEVFDFDVNYLDRDFSPVMDTLRRVELGANSNLEGCCLRGLLLGGRYLYRNPYEPARLSDDEIAIAGCMEKMYESLNGGKNFYPLEQALQDSYLSLMMNQAAETGLSVTTERQPWAEK